MIAPNSQEDTAPKNAALYIDGFNLYHAVDDLNKPFLKWINLWRLGSIILPQHSQKLVKVVFCTAFYPGHAKKKWRHEQFNGAQSVYGVGVQLGHYVYEDMDCRECESSWKKPTEKGGDINVAIHLIKDGMSNVYDHAYLLSSDSDQAATARMFRQTFGDKTLTTIAPPGRNFSTHIAKFAHSRIALSEDHIEKCVMPPVVFRQGVGSYRRPREYDPPQGWVHPDSRP